MPRYAPISLLAAGLLIAACGSSSNTPSSTGSTGSTGSAGTAVTKDSPIAFSKCMRAHGVPNFPDPAGNGAGGIRIQARQTTGSGQTMTVNGVPVNAPAFQSAMQTCHSQLPGSGGSTAESAPGLQKAALAMARCMRAHGVPDFPDPTVHSGSNGGTLVQMGGPGVDPSSPAFQAANKICAPLMGKQFADGAGVANGP